MTLPNRKLFSSHEKPTNERKKKKRGRNCQTTTKLSKKELQSINLEQAQSVRKPGRKNNSGKSTSKSNERNKNKNNNIINNDNDQTKIFECLEEIRSTLQHSFNLFGNLVGLLKKEMNRNNNNILLNKKTNRNKNKNQKFEKEDSSFSLMDLDGDYPRKKNNKKINKIDDDDDAISLYNYSNNDKKNKKKIK